MNDTRSILLTGVGGQGTILAAKILSEGLTRMGYDVKMSEIHGMAQRGGSVTSHVRYGSRVDSPVISEGEADILCSFEKLEAFRHLGYIKPEGMLIVNDLEIYPLPVLIGQAAYPDDITAVLKTRHERFQLLSAHAIAEKLGNPRVENIVLLGAVAHYGGFMQFSWEETIRDLVKPAFIDINIKAFYAGAKAASASFGGAS